MPWKRWKQGQRSEETQARAKPNEIAQAKGSRSASGRRQGCLGGLKAPRVSEQTDHRWRKQYGGLTADDAKRLKSLHKENSRLKRIVADKELEIDALREIAKGNF